MLSTLFFVISLLDFCILEIFIFYNINASGNGKPIQIYDGRRSLGENKEEALVSTGKLQPDEDSGKGQIIYFRDSDDEMPDSDEDPDDDLDI